MQQKNPPLSFQSFVTALVDLKWQGEDLEWGYHFSLTGIVREMMPLFFYGPLKNPALVPLFGPDVNGWYVKFGGKQTNSVFSSDGSST